MITTTQYAIHVNAKDLKRNFAENAMEQLQDMLKDDLEFWEMDFNRFQDYLTEMNRDGFRGVFKDGMTMFLLSAKDQEDVEYYFRTHSADDDSKLQIVISSEGKEDEVIEECDIIY